MDAKKRIGLWAVVASGGTLFVEHVLPAFPEAVGNAAKWFWGLLTEIRPVSALLGLAVGGAVAYFLGRKRGWSRARAEAATALQAERLAATRLVITSATFTHGTRNGRHAWLLLVVLRIEGSRAVGMGRDLPSFRTELRCSMMEGWRDNISEAAFRMDVNSSGDLDMHFEREINEEAVSLWLEAAKLECRATVRVCNTSIISDVGEVVNSGPPVVIHADWRAFSPPTRAAGT